MKLGNLGRDGVDVELGEGVVLELARGENDLEQWGVWGVRIEGTLYREPRDLSPDWLPESSEFVRRLNQAVHSREYAEMAAEQGPAALS